MDVSKLKNPPFRTELAFGSGAEDILHLLLDRDIVTEEFLTRMDHSARRIFASTMSSVRMVVEQEKRKLGSAGMQVGGVKKKKRLTKAQKVAQEKKELAEREAAALRTGDDVLKDLASMMPNENESWLLAQAEECTYMSETLARVILEWDLTKAKVLMPITVVRDFGCCKAEGSDCRHPSDFLRSRPLEILRRLFTFCLFEAQAPKKKAETQ